MTIHVTYQVLLTFTININCTKFSSRNSILTLSFDESDKLFLEDMSKGSILLLLLFIDNHKATSLYEENNNRTQKHSFCATFCMKSALRSYETCAFTLRMRLMNHFYHKKQTPMIECGVLNSLNSTITRFQFFNILKERNPYIFKDLRR